MANKFYEWCEDTSNVESATDFNSDSERQTGFIGGTPAKATKVNTALRQANLIACALADVLIPNNQTLNVKSSRSDVTSALGNALSNLSVLQATYASSDHAKGTIEERLTALGFREGVVSLNVGTAPVNKVYRQGNYCYINLKITNLTWSGVMGGVLGTLPTEFRPKTQISQLAGNYEAVGSYNFTIYDCVIDTSGNINLNYIMGVTNPSAEHPIYIHMGWECDPIIMSKWIINENPNLINLNTNIKFYSSENGNITYSNPFNRLSISSTNNNITYSKVTSSISLDIVVYNSNSIPGWPYSGYKTVVFEGRPTGDLLTWLQANATEITN